MDLDDKQVFFLMNHFSGKFPVSFADKVECFISESMIKFEKQVTANFLSELGV